MKAAFIVGALWLGFIITKQFFNPYGPHFAPDHAIGVIIMAGIGSYIFKDTK